MTWSQPLLRGVIGSVSNLHPGGPGADFCLAFTSTGCPTWLDLPEHHHPSASHLSKTREKTEVERHRLSGHEGWSKQDSSFNFQLCVNHQLNHIFRQTGLVMQLLWNSRCRWDWSELPERLSVRLGHCVCVCVYITHLAVRKLLLQQPQSSPLGSAPWTQSGFQVFLVLHVISYWCKQKTWFTTGELLRWIKHYFFYISFAQT